MSQQGYFPELYISYKVEQAKEVKDGLVQGIPSQAEDIYYCQKPLVE